MLLTFWRAGWIAFVTMILRALIFFGGYGALNGKVEGNRTWLGGHGLYREVPPWLYHILLGYEIGACIAYWLQWSRSRYSSDAQGIGRFSECRKQDRRTA